MHLSFSTEHGYCFVLFLFSFFVLSLFYELLGSESSLNYEYHSVWVMILFFINFFWWGDALSHEINENATQKISSYIFYFKNDFFFFFIKVVFIFYSNLSNVKITVFPFLKIWEKFTFFFPFLIFLNYNIWNCTATKYWLYIVIKQE